MSIAKDVVYALHERLKTLSKDATPDQLAYLAKAMEAIAGKSTTLDIIDIGDQQCKAIQDTADESETLAVTAIETAHQGSLDSIDQLRADVLKAIDTVQTTNLSLLGNAKEKSVEALQHIVLQYDFIAKWFDHIKEKTLHDVMRSEILPSNTLPFLFGVLSRSNDHYGLGTFTSQTGSWTNVANANSILQILTGCHNYTTQYIGFYKPPQLYYLQGAKGSWVYNENIYRYGHSVNMYSYPYAALGVLFVTNTTDVDISKSLSFGGSSYWSSGYEGMALYMGVPDKTNAEKSNITKVDWQSIYSYTASNACRGATSTITVPANKTVAIVLYTSAHCNYTSSPYRQFLHWNMQSVRTNFLTDGLTIDLDRTKKAWQCAGFSETHQIWQ